MERAVPQPRFVYFFNTNLGVFSLGIFRLTLNPPGTRPVPGTPEPHNPDFAFLLIPLFAMRVP